MKMTKGTRLATLAVALLDEPLLALFQLLPFILLSRLEASAFQIVLFTCLQPISALLAFYWSSNLSARPDKLRSKMVRAGIYARIPFLIAPLIGTASAMVIAAALYSFFSRAAIPAWMEVLKRNVKKGEREKLFSWSTGLGYAEGALLSIGIGTMLDAATSAWKLLFILATLIGLVRVWLQKKLPIRDEDPTIEIPKAKIPLSEHLTRPWKESFRLLLARPDFAKFQWGFMAGGFGLMLLMPARPFFFDEVLHLSFTKIAIAISIFKGLSFLFASPIWASAMNRFKIEGLVKTLLVLFAFFPIFLIAAVSSSFFLYVAFTIYGIAQAGSHLVWHLSGPHYAQGEESSRYSNVNVLMVGLRGLIGPILGGFLTTAISPLFVFLLATACCFYGYFVMRSSAPAPLTRWLWKWSQSEEKSPPYTS